MAPDGVRQDGDGLQDRFSPSRRDSFQDGGEIGIEPIFDVLERFSSLGGQGDHDITAVSGARRPIDQSDQDQALDRPAQSAGLQAEGRGQVDKRNFTPMSDLEERVALGQGQTAAISLIVERTDRFPLQEAEFLSEKTGFLRIHFAGHIFTSQYLYNTTI
jgi:hypothetical protein